MNRLLSFLKHIRSRDEQVKRRYLAAFSAAAMVLVVALWVGYFKNFVLQRAEGEPQTATTETPQSSPDAWDSFVGGAATVYRAIAGPIGKTLRALKTPKRYEVQPLP